MSDSNDKSNSNSSSNNNSIRLVVQRYRKASLLIDEKTVVTVGYGDGDGDCDGSGVGTGDASTSSLSLIGSANGASSASGANHIGMLVYISFSKRAIPQEVQKAARTILNLPIQTEGAWGDGSKTQSILQVAVEAWKRRQQSGRTKDKQDGSVCSSVSTSNSVSILLVPQANLIAKVKKNGKSVQYRDQIDKANGETLYNLFVESVEEFLLEEYKQQHGQGVSGEKIQTTSNKSNATTAKASIDPSVLPKDYFQCLDAQLENPMYGSFEPTTGLPLTAADGNPLTKSASKRIRKLYDAHVKRHEKYLASQPKSEPNQVDEESSKQTQPSENGGGDKKETPLTTPQAESTAKERLDPSFVKLVAGSFGKRQGLELVSDMGPFCHVIDI